MAVVRRVGPARWASAFHMAWRPSINSAGRKVNSDSPHPGSPRKRPPSVPRPHWGTYVAKARKA